MRFITFFQKISVYLHTKLFRNREIPNCITNLRISGFFFLVLHTNISEFLSNLIPKFWIFSHAI